MKKLFTTILALSWAFSSYSQINLCPKNDVDWTTKLQALPDSDLPIINVRRIMTQEYVKSIKIPERIFGVLSLDDKFYLGYSDSKIYKINIETQEIQSFPFQKKGTLPSGDEFEWNFPVSLDGTMYLYRSSKKTALPLNLYKVNFGSQTTELVWETGLSISEQVKFKKMPSTDYWTYADDHGTAMVLDITTKRRIMDVQFPVPSELVDRPGASFMISLRQSNKGGWKYLCSRVNYDITDYETGQSYIAQYDLNSNQTIVSQVVDGSPHEWLSNGKSYWVVYKFNKPTTNVTVYNDSKFSDVRFKFTELKDGGNCIKLKHSDTGVLETVSVTYASGTIETYDWATKKLLKTEKAKAEVIDF